MNSLKFFIYKILLFFNNCIDNIFFDKFIKNFYKQSYKNQICIFEYAGIGDFFLSSIFINFLIQKHKNDHIIILISDSVFPVALYFFKKYKNIKIIPIDYSKLMINPIYRYRFLKNVGVINICYITHPTVTSIMENIIKKLKINNIIAYEGELVFYPKNKINHNRVFYIKNIIPNEKNILLHQLSYIERVIGEQINKDKIYLIYKKILQTEKQTLEKDLRTKDDYIVILPETSTKHKDFSLEQIQYLIDSINFKIVLIGTKQIKLDLKNKSNVINLIGKTSLLESMNIIKNAKLVIGNDTGLIHFSYLLGKPTLVCLGGWQYGRYYPTLPLFPVKIINYYMDCYGCNFQCYDKVSVPYPCMKNIKLEDIIKEINLFFKKNSNE